MKNRDFRAKPRDMATLSTSLKTLRSKETFFPLQQRRNFDNVFHAHLVSLGWGLLSSSSLVQERACAVSTSWMNADDVNRYKILEKPRYSEIKKLCYYVPRKKSTIQLEPGTVKKGPVQYVSRARSCMKVCFVCLQQSVCERCCVC